MWLGCNRNFAGPQYICIACQDQKSSFLDFYEIFVLGLKVLRLNTKSYPAHRPTNVHAAGMPKPQSSRH